jgi:hypothetical protein
MSLVHRNRVLTTSLVAAFLLASRWLWPEPQTRADHQYLLVITLGYGHLIGAAVFSRRRAAGLVPAGVGPRLFWSFAAVSIANLFVLYAWLSNLSGIFFLPLLAVSMWHIVENDLALGRAYREGLALGALPLSLEEQLAALGLTALLLAFGQALLPPDAYGPALSASPLVRAGSAPMRIAAAACGLAFLATRRRGGLGLALAAASLTSPTQIERWVSFGDFFSAVTLHHLLQFLVLFADRARALPDTTARRELVRRLAWVHLPPAALCVVLLLVPGQRLAALRYAIFSPSIYLFWSVLHVVQTLATRGIERRPARASRALGA